MGFEKDIEGRGIWWVLHHTAAKAKKSKHVNAVLYNIEIIKSNFECNKCKKHFKKFIKYNDPYEYAKNGRIFEWTILAHNNVNKMNGGKEWSLEYAKKLYDY